MAIDRLARRDDRQRRALQTLNADLEAVSAAGPGLESVGGSLQVAAGDSTEVLNGVLEVRLTTPAPAIEIVPDQGLQVQIGNADQLVRRVEAGLQVGQAFSLQAADGSAFTATQAIPFAGVLPGTGEGMVMPAAGRLVMHAVNAVLDAGSMDQVDFQVEVAGAVAAALTLAIDVGTDGTGSIVKRVVGQVVEFAAGDLVRVLATVTGTIQVDRCFVFLGGYYDPQ